MSASIFGRFVGVLASGLIALALASPVVAAQDVDELLREAQLAMTKGRPQDAIGLLRKAIDMDPNRAELYMLRSRARESTGKYQAALEDATRYIQLEPSDAFGYLNRARIYLSLDKPNAALEDANKAIELAPDEPDGYYRRADVYLQLGKKAEAQADEAKADELDRKYQGGTA